MNPYVNSVLTVVTLFFIGLVSPGPNFFVVVQSTLRWGKLAGFLTGLGAATGDALYAACGLFGVAQLIERGGLVMTIIKFLGGLYLLWIGFQMALRRSAFLTDFNATSSVPRSSPVRHFARGLATDLSNPKTIVFFASIFAVVVQPATPSAVRLAMVIGIVSTSVAWRFFLSVVFSTAPMRNTYRRTHVYVERIFGVTLCLLGTRLVTRASAS